MNDVKIPARIIGHEAAHAVAAQLLGLRVVEMNITPTSAKSTNDPTCVANGCVTTIFHGGDINGFLRKLHAGQATCDDAVRMMTVFLAGPAAQGSGVGGASDRGKAEAIAFQYAGKNDAAARALLGIARTRAESLVKKYRPSIKKLSAALAAKKTLRGPELQRMLRAV